MTKTETEYEPVRRVRNGSPDSFFDYYDFPLLCTNWTMKFRQFFYPIFTLFDNIIVYKYGIS